MAYDKTLLTSPPIGLRLENNTSLGFGGYFIVAYNANMGTKFQGSCNVANNMDTDWGQIEEALAYCGIAFNSSAELQNWYKAQTAVSFINAIRKYLVEVLFPRLVAFANKYAGASGGAPSTGELTTPLQGWQAILGRMDVVYNLNGTIKEFTI